MHHLRHLPRPPRRHLPEELNLHRAAAVLEAGRELLARPVAGAADLQQWLAHRAEYDAAVEEALLLARLEFGDQPADPHRRSWLSGLHEELGAPLAELRHRLDRKVWESPARADLPEAWQATQAPALRRRLVLFRESNLALEVRLGQLELDYVHLASALSIPRSGRPCHLAEMRHLLQREDPVTRRAVWEERAALLAGLRPAFEDLLDEMLALREQIARNGDRPDWNSWRAAQGLAPAAWGAADLAALAAPAAQRPWDMAACGDGGGGRFADPEIMVEELAEDLSYHAPRLAGALRRMQILRLLDLRARPGKLDLDACLWLAEHRLPLLHMSFLDLEDDLCRFLRHLQAAERGLAECAAGRPPAGTRLDPDSAAREEARVVADDLLGDLEPEQARRSRARLEALRRLELRQSLCGEAWAWWAGEKPGAGREARRGAWTRLLALAWPGLAGKAGRPELEDTLFLETAVFLPDWAPPSRARYLLGAPA